MIIDPALPYTFSVFTVTFSGFRLNDFIIGLTDVSPSVQAPVLWDYDVCGQGPSQVGDGVTVHLKCADNLPPRRYLVFQIPRHEILNVCEVQVYPRRTYIYH